MVLDGPDPGALGEFCRALLGGDVTYADDDWVNVRDGGIVLLSFQRASAKHRQVNQLDLAHPVPMSDHAGTRRRAQQRRRLAITTRNQLGHSPTPATTTSSRPTSSAHMRVGSLSNRGSSTRSPSTPSESRAPVPANADPYRTVIPPSDPKPSLPTPTRGAQDVELGATDAGETEQTSLLDSARPRRGSADAVDEAVKARGNEAGYGADGWMDDLRPACGSG
jgi:hypothetical protein